MSDRTFRQVTDSLPISETHVNNLWNLVEVLQARVSSLEAEHRVSLQPRNNPSDGLYYCRAVNCGRTFGTQTNLNEHIGSATGPGHRAMQATINRINCQVCDRHLKQPQALTPRETRLRSNSVGTHSTNRLEQRLPQLNSGE